MLPVRKGSGMVPRLIEQPELKPTAKSGPQAALEEKAAALMEAMDSAMLGQFTQYVCRRHRPRDEVELYSTQPCALMGA